MKTTATKGTKKAAPKRRNTVARKSDVTTKKVPANKQPKY